LAISLAISLTISLAAAPGVVGDFVRGGGNPGGGNPGGSGNPRVLLAISLAILLTILLMAATPGCRWQFCWR
jgi:hypothetical protein